MRLIHATVAATALLAACSSADPTGFGDPLDASTGDGSASSSVPPASSAAATGASDTGGYASAAAATAATSPPAAATTAPAPTEAPSSSSSAFTSATSSVSDTSVATGDPEPANMVGMTAAHNAARAAVVPAANPSLPPDTWSAKVAASAQAWADNCVFEDTGPPYGSNAFAGTGKYTPGQVVASWVSEDANYDYATNTCAPGQMCGHYTQVVWRDSTEIGCGMANCTTNSPFGGGEWQLWICNYNPPGNYIGESPY